MPRRSSASVAGAQTVDRACTLLKEIARHGASGARLLDLTKNSGLCRPTVHRILQSLASPAFVRQDPATRRYQLGVGLFALGLAAPNPVAPSISRFSLWQKPLRRTAAIWRRT